MVGSENDLEVVSSAFQRRVDELAAVIVARSRQEIRELRDFDAPPFWAAVGEITRDSRRTLADRLGQRRAAPVECPAPDLLAARLAARTGVSLPGCLHSYRIAHAVGSEAWLDAIDGAQLEESSRRACLRTVTRFVEVYDDRLMELFTDEYTRACGAGRHSGPRRLALVRALLDGTSDDASALGYDLERDHIAVIAWGGGVARAVQRLAAMLGAQLLVCDMSDEVLWAWMGRRERFARAERERIAHFEPAPGSALCVGEPEHGPAGFRCTHRQAGAAYLVAVHRPRPVTLYADVALEAMALRDEPAAREFTATELGRLDADQRLHDTLRHYFACAQNAASTAASLGVHEQTVARRVRAVEAKIGQPLNARRAELELALRLDSLLDDEDHT